MIQPIRIYGDPVLEQVCAEVKDFAAPEVKSVIQDLLDTCQATENSAGLAAPQIGVLLRVAVVRTSFNKNKNDFLVLINPRVVSQSGRSEEQEGCLSIPGHRDKMTRADSVTVQYQDQFSEVQSVKGTGFFARALVHEIDHLDGRLFIHYFGGAYCAAVKEWLGRQSGVVHYTENWQETEKPIEKSSEPTPGSAFPAVSGVSPQEIRALPDTEEIPALPEASFVQATREEDDLLIDDDISGEMADREQ